MSVSLPDSHVFLWSLEEPPKPQSVPNLTLSLVDVDAEPTEEVPLVLEPEQPEDCPGADCGLSPEAALASGEQRQDPLMRHSASDTDRGLETSPNLDKYTLYSDGSDFESDLSVCNFCIEISQDILEKGAQAQSLLPAAPTPDKGTVRKMALSVVE